MFGWSCLRVDRLKLVYVVFSVRWVSAQQVKALLADQTIDGCVIATVIDDGLTAAQSDCGGRVWVIPVIIITWYRAVV